MTDIQVLHGDCIEEMRRLKDAGVLVDAIVTDPPAGIAFMGKDWDKDKGGRDQWIAWMQEVASLAFDLIKPGGHALVWALPRTSHWTATAWENAGWEVRDRVAHLFGTGFPKSMSVDKAIDKMLGAKRTEVIGITRKSIASMAPGEGNFSDDGYQWKSEFERTAPATDAAKQWAGWHTALKPACEDWWLLRKPLQSRTSQMELTPEVLATWEAKRCARV